MFGKEAFATELKALGFNAADLGENRLAFKYVIGEGRFKDQAITIGLEVPPDFNVTCPTGPHISPRLIPINTGALGNDRAAESPNFGAEWQYLSRPFGEQQMGWGRTNRTVKAYLRHIKRILEVL
jgi:hypothetical protein